MESNSEQQKQIIKLFQGFESGTTKAIEDIIDLFSTTANFFMWGPHVDPMKGHAELREGFEAMVK